jgi:hypothetical protein
MLQSFVSSTPADALPGWAVVAVILAGFALLVAPVLYVALQRLNRRGLSWRAVPLAALIISALLATVGLSRGGNTIGNVVSAVHLDPDAGVAPRQVMAAGFYRPMQTSLRVTAPGEASTRVQSAYGGAPYLTSGDGSPPARFVLGQDTSVDFGSANQWSMRTLSLERQLRPDDVGSLGSSLIVDGSTIVGEVRNDTPVVLENVTVIARNSLNRVGTLKPGESQTVRLRPTAPSPTAAQPSGPTVSQLFGSPMRDADSSSESPDPTGGLGDYEMRRRTWLASYAAPQLQGPRPPGFGGAPSINIVAFTRQPIGPNQPTVGDHPTYYLSLIDQPLRLSLPAGPFRIPVGMLPPETLNESYTPYSMPVQSITMGSPTFGVGVSSSYRFPLPIPAAARVERITISTRQIGAARPTATNPFEARAAAADPDQEPRAADAGSFEIYNWQTGDWEPLANGEDEQRVLDPATPYVDVDQVVQVRTKAQQSGNSSRIIPPEIAVEGRVP